MASNVRADKVRDEIFNDEITVYECPQCGVRAATRPMLREHLLKKHDIAQSKVTRIQKKMEQKVRVKVNEAPAAAPAPIVRKIREPIDPEISEAMDKLYYNCRVCFQAFEEMEGLEIHVQSHHDDLLASKVSCNPPVSECWHCGKSFANKNNLGRHVLTLHHGYRGFKCNICYAKFGDKRSVVKHLQKEHQADENNNEDYEVLPKPSNIRIEPIPKDMYFIG